MFCPTGGGFKLILFLQPRQVEAILLQNKTRSVSQIEMCNTIFSSHKEKQEMYTFIVSPKSIIRTKSKPIGKQRGFFFNLCIFLSLYLCFPVSKLCSGFQVYASNYNFCLSSLFWQNPLSPSRILSVKLEAYLPASG